MAHHLGSMAALDGNIDVEALAGRPFLLSVA